MGADLTIPLIASGGAYTPAHLVESIEEANVDAVLAASMFHYGEYTVGEVKAAMHERGVPVRL